MKTLVGIALVVLHGIAFALYVPGCRRPELVLEIVDSAATFPMDLQNRRHESVGTRLVYDRYTSTYRGGYTRSVGRASLAGPFQNPSERACTGRVVVGQRLLDDGKAGPGTIAGELVKSLETELAGESYFGAGSFERVKDTSLRWAELAKHPDDMTMLNSAPHGYVRAMVTLVFTRIEIPIVVALVPAVSADKLEFSIAARAEIVFGNRVLDWVSDKLGGDKLATRLAKREIDSALVTALAPPPPFDIPGGRKLVFGYCDGAPEIVDGVGGALPFSVAIQALDHATILPPRIGPAPHRPLSPATTLAIDFDLDGANALLYELWRTGYLDDRLAAAGLDRRFNEDPTVQEFLTLRISPPRLALPPVLQASGDKLELFADARVTIKDGDALTVGRVWGGLDFKLAGKVEPIAVDLGALELTCERSPTTLVPCYADLVGALRDRGGQFHGELTRTFAKLVDDIFVDQRVGASGLTADVVIRAAATTVTTRDDNGSLHLELDAVLAPKR